MVLTTSQLRRAWDPPCKGTQVSLAQAYLRLDQILHKYNYRPRLGVTGAYNCRVITGGIGYSLHSYGPGGIFTFWSGVRVSMAVAVDINWDTNPYSTVLRTDMPRAMVNEILALRTNNGKQVWAWGGNYSGNKDAMHYEIVCAPVDIETGIPFPAQPPTTPPTQPPTQAKDDVVYALVQGGKPNPDGPGLVPATAQWWLTNLIDAQHMDSQATADAYVYIIKMHGGIVALGAGGGPQLWPQEMVDALRKSEVNLFDQTLAWYKGVGDSYLHEIIRQVLKDELQETPDAG